MILHPCCQFNLFLGTVLVARQNYVLKHSFNEELVISKREFFHDALMMKHGVIVRIPSGSFLNVPMLLIHWIP